MISSPAEFRFAAAHPCLHADAAQPVEQQRADLRVGGDGQVLAHARAGIEIADRRRHPPFVNVGNGDRKIPVAEFRVLVDQKIVAGRLECFAGRLGMFRPQIGKDAAHRDAAFVAVPRTVEVHVALDLLEERQHAVPVPPGRAARMPLVVVGRRAAIGELAVDRRTAAQHARLLVRAQLRARLVGPVVRDDLGRDLQCGPSVGAGSGMRCRDRNRGSPPAPCHAACPAPPPAAAPCWRCAQTAGSRGQSRRSRRRR